tara:strand:+ start:32 stop:637 length:606 start_codon:yes stop_codon:yes gene_type:complete
MIDDHFEKYEEPYLHFVSIGASLEDEVANECYQLAKPSILEDTRGSRADYKERVFLKKTLRHNYSNKLNNFLEYLHSDEFLELANKKYDVDLTGSSLRAEVACDVDGFFQVPHTDVGDKRITWLTYLGTEEENGDVGTDIYSDADTFYKSVPWGFNNGLIFKPRESLTWHGFSKGKKIKGNRRVLIINFVDNWVDDHELYK